MKIFKLVVTAAAVSLALSVFVLSGCGDDNGANSGGGSYASVNINGKRWMTKNLNIETEDSWCYKNQAANCDKYGRLYTWEAAKKACKSAGWKLPSRKDWDHLAASIGGHKSSDYEDWHDWLNVGLLLKAASDWSGGGNGLGDPYGFSALPGGYSVGADYFNDAGSYGYWWTTTETDKDYFCGLKGNTFIFGCVYGRSMNYKDDYLREITGEDDVGYSVRCVK